MTMNSNDGPIGGVAPQSTRVMNLAYLITRNARRFPDRAGLIWGDASWTWKEIDAEVNAFAAALAERGLVKGDRLLVHSKNTAQMFFSMFAAFKLGVVWVPCNFRLLPDEVVYLAEFSGAKGFLCHGDFPQHAHAVREQVTSLQFIWRLDEQAKAATFGEMDVSQALARHRGRAVADVAVQHYDPCWFFFTSGSTGKSKAAVLCHGQMAFVLTNHLCDLLPGTTELDASLVVAPLSHGAGVHQLNIVARGATTILLPSERLDIEEAWRLVERHKVTNMFTVPTILKMLTEHPAVDRFDHSSLRHVIYAGAPMYREDQKHALKKLGRVIVQYFGLGEVTGNITVFPPSLHDLEDGPATKIGTCGFERTGMQVSIQDDAGRDLGLGETGEICVAGPAVFAGYYNNPAANAAAFRNGWFRTGDIGHMDAEGFLYITGRASDMYISGGSNIYPLEIEEKILTHDGIAEVAVLGVPDKMWGEVGIAVCVKRPGATVSEEDLFVYVGAKVPRYKMPKRFLFWDALPKSGYGKVPKRLVRDEFERRERAPAGNTATRPAAMKQPGAPLEPRIVAVPVRVNEFPIELRAGGPLLAQLRSGFARNGFAGGVVNTSSLALGPFAYVGPALSKTGENVAFYSDTCRPEGIARLHTCAITVGERDGAPFFHCHALWKEADGRESGGHILPEEAIVAEDCTLTGFGLDGAMFVAEPDSETRFKLFGPVARAATGIGSSDAFAMRLRPNQDFCGTLEQFCATHAITRARLRGGVGSIIGAEFEDGRIVVPFATELLLKAGVIAPDAQGAMRAELDVALVDYTGGRHEGRLARGRNPILMTMEVVLEVLERRTA